MTRLELSLGNQFVWALVEPLSKEFIKDVQELGYQRTNLILSESNPGPVKIELETLPAWAKAQVITAIKSGQLINTGDKIVRALEPEKEIIKELPVAKEQKPRSKNKSKPGSNDHL
jgi:hypothetical protein